MTCRYCLKEKTLGRSHVIPRSFFPVQGKDGRPNRILTNTKGIHPKQSRIGVYDETILCHKCEREFDRPDNYAYRILIQKRTKFGHLFLNGELVGKELKEYDYWLLKKFFISVLWRASISSQPFFNRIHLPELEPNLLQILQTSHSIEPDILSVNLAEFDEPGRQVILDPHLTTFDGIAYAVFYLGGYIAYIKLDDQPTPAGLAPLIMRPSVPLAVIGRDFRGSKELEIIRGIALLPNNKI